LTKDETERICEFKQTFPSLCKGKTDEVLLLQLKFIEAVKKEIDRERRRLAALQRGQKAKGTASGILYGGLKNAVSGDAPCAPGAN